MWGEWKEACKALVKRKNIVPILKFNISERNNKHMMLTLCTCINWHAVCFGFSSFLLLTLTLGLMSYSDSDVFHIVIVYLTKVSWNAEAVCVNNKAHPVFQKLV